MLKYPVKYSVVVPVYRGELTLKELTSEIVGFFNSNKLSFEIIFVDDFALDKSWNDINFLKSEYGNLIRGIRLSKNFGQHNALLCGIRSATGEYIITMDEDLQHSPADIIQLINKQNESDYDLVYGRFTKLNHNRFRNMTSWLLKKLLRIGLPGLHPDYSAFRLIKATVAKKAFSGVASTTFIDAFFSITKNTVTSTEVDHSKRLAGNSSYNLLKLINHSASIFVYYSVPVIRVLSWSFLILSFIIFTGIVFFLLRNVLSITNLTGRYLGYEIGETFLLLIIFISGTIYFASLIVSILRIKKSGVIESEII